jgi:hypothetical protein
MSPTGLVHLRYSLDDFEGIALRFPVSLGLRVDFVTFDVDSFSRLLLTVPD